MSKFLPNTDYYGGFAHIKTDYTGIVHLYKIVNAIQSNKYCDVPIRYGTEAYIHDKIVPVLNVIHCGIDESKVIRVAFKDCDKIITPEERFCSCLSDPVIFGRVRKRAEKVDEARQARMMDIIKSNFDELFNDKDDDYDL